MTKKQNSNKKTLRQLKTNQLEKKKLKDTSNKFKWYKILNKLFDELQKIPTTL
jgi:hypothetical protein